VERFGEQNTEDRQKKVVETLFSLIALLREARAEALEGNGTNRKPLWVDVG
jgi:hypothetical protein